MRIIDKNTDFYDFWQNVYPDTSITFDRTDSFLLTKEIFCEHLHVSRNRYRFIKDYKSHNFVLLQVCNSFWLFLAEITKETEYGIPKDYTIELLTTWKNYNKPRCLVKLDVIDFDWHVDSALYRDRYYKTYDKAKIKDKTKILIQAVDTNNFRVIDSINRHTIYKGSYDTRFSGHNTIEKHIPLLKACGIGNCVDPLEIYLAFEEYFSLEKTSSERTTSIGLTNNEKIGNHGFDVKTSFRGKS